MRFLLSAVFVALSLGLVAVEAQPSGGNNSTIPTSKLFPAGERKQQKAHGKPTMEGGCGGAYPPSPFNYPAQPRTKGDCKTSGKTTKCTFAFPSSAYWNQTHVGINGIFTTPCKGTGSVVLIGGAGGMSYDQGAHAPGTKVTSAIRVFGRTAIEKHTTFVVQVGGQGETGFLDGNYYGGWPNGGHGFGDDSNDGSDYGNYYEYDGRDSVAKIKQLAIPAPPYYNIQSGGGGGGSTELIGCLTGKRLVVAAGGGGNGYSRSGGDVFNPDYYGRPATDGQVTTTWRGADVPAGVFSNTGGGGGGLFGGAAGTDGNGGYAGKSLGDTIVEAGGANGAAGSAVITFTAVL
ncbi:unnamed protein product [Tilletia laevis]|uniref:Uncharacterized protein n=3 Tax=Tilletia TaxID=13289 RepID=A0A8X7MM37_9BASI|nr:hypothetical protein A4X06_0g7909 [Tilletia controversa]KAE8262076.1 hypothetical protein A4X03_0g2742 [Tilletia caries]CAD6952692.1 unnamed protein product [Tilletia laevis]CAD6889365.1 unnamed protein product [Tilletia caries]CAD6938479.1 unnamed protein product [Tilletia caries]